MDQFKKRKQLVPEFKTEQECVDFVLGLYRTGDYLWAEIRGLIARSAKEEDLNFWFESAVTLARREARDAGKEFVGPEEEGQNWQDFERTIIEEEVRLGGDMAGIIQEATETSIGRPSGDLPSELPAALPD